MCSVAYSAVTAGLLLTPTSGVPVASLMAETSQRQTIEQQLGAMDSISTTFASIASPKIEDPQWLKAKKAAEAAARKTAAITATVTYQVSSRGTLSASLAEFKALVNQTLNDTRGWARLGVAFQEVASGGSFTFILSEASQMTSFSTGCSVEYSCRVGTSVIINQDRWVGATAPWNSAGGSLRDYRHMVVNHEVGHWLGHGHAACGGAGQQAPVMLQQSIDLQGCAFNPWPLASELWSSQLGVAKP